MSLPANVHAPALSVQSETDSESFGTSSLPADERPTMADVMRDLERDAQWFAECEARDDADWAEMMERHDRTEIVPVTLPDCDRYFDDLIAAVEAHADALDSAPSIAEAVSVTPQPRDFTREIRECGGFIASIKLVAEHAEHERNRRAKAVR